MTSFIFIQIYFQIAYGQITCDSLFPLTHHFWTNDSSSTIHLFPLTFMVKGVYHND